MKASGSKHVSYQEHSRAEHRQMVNAIASRVSLLKLNTSGSKYLPDPRDSQKKWFR